jgi:hypothetical protein
LLDCCQKSARVLRLAPVVMLPFRMIKAKELFQEVVGRKQYPLDVLPVLKNERQPDSHFLSSIRCSESNECKNRPKARPQKKLKPLIFLL